MNTNFQRVNRIRVILCLAAFGVAGMSIGCGKQGADYSHLGLVDVYGQIQLDGAPVTDTVIVVEDVASGLQSYAMTDSSGEYRLNFDSEEYGVIPGDKKVLISSQIKILGLNSDEEGGEPNEEGEGEEESVTDVEKIPAGYFGKDTKLRVTITADSSRLDFNLAADGTTTGAAE